MKWLKISVISRNNWFHTFTVTIQCRKLATRGYIVSPSITVCVTTLPCKIFITTLRMLVHDMFTVDFEARRRLRSAFSLSLNVRRTRLCTIGDRAFPVAAARTWNNLPQHVTSVVRTLYVCFPRSPEGYSFRAFLPMTFTATFIQFCHTDLNVLTCQVAV